MQNEIIIEWGREAKTLLIYLFAFIENRQSYLIAFQMNQRHRFSTEWKREKKIEILKMEYDFRFIEILFSSFFISLSENT